MVATTQHGQQAFIINHLKNNNVIPQLHFVVPVKIENMVHNVHVIKLPGADKFMRKMGTPYRVVFTSSLS
ncbi:hypothetical protein PCANC_25221, partial [Puccinia coronata f. sp. avenae]